MSSRSSSGRRGSGSADPMAPLALGVKGRLSNQEMEQLKHQLATAVAYDHVREDKRAERHSKTTSTPMTRVYRTLPPEPRTNQPTSFRPSIKPQSAIEFEKQFVTYDALRMRPAPRGISATAKTVLQDEYVTRPREISVVPRNKHTESDQDVSEAPPAAGKRHAPPAIPQVFIL